MSKLKDAIKSFVGTDDIKSIEDKNRFYFMLQQMQNNRWKITGIVLFLFFFIVLGINAGIIFGLTVGEPMIAATPTHCSAMMFTFCKHKFIKS